MGLDKIFRAVYTNWHYHWNLCSSSRMYKTHLETHTVHFYRSVINLENKLDLSALSSGTEKIELHTTNVTNMKTSHPRRCRRDRQMVDGLCTYSHAARIQIYHLNSTVNNATFAICNEKHQNCPSSRQPWLWFVHVHWSRCDWLGQITGVLFVFLH